VSVSRNGLYGTPNAKYGPSGSAYVTYRRADDAERCIKNVHLSLWHGKTVKACFGTTKYCNAFLKGLPCNNSDCLYLHDVADDEASYTREETKTQRFASVVHAAGKGSAASLASSRSYDDFQMDFEPGQSPFLNDCYPLSEQPSMELPTEASSSTSPAALRSGSGSWAARTSSGSLGLHASGLTTPAALPPPVVPSSDDAIEWPELSSAPSGGSALPSPGPVRHANGLERAASSREALTRQPSSNSKGLPPATPTSSRTVLSQKAQKSSPNGASTLPRVWSGGLTASSPTATPDKAAVNETTGSNRASSPEVATVPGVESPKASQHVGSDASSSSTDLPAAAVGQTLLADNSGPKVKPRPPPPGFPAPAVRPSPPGFDMRPQTPVDLQQRPRTHRPPPPGFENLPSAFHSYGSDTSQASSRRWATFRARRSAADSPCWVASQWDGAATSLMTPSHIEVIASQHWQACKPGIVRSYFRAPLENLDFQKSFRLDDLDLVTRARFNFKQNTGSLRTRVLGGVGSLNLTPTGHSIAWRKNLRTAVGSLALVATLQQPGGLQLPFGPPNRLPMQHHYGGACSLQSQSLQYCNDCKLIWH
ncbi:hypothetical protein WJX84_011780, partial [Apatococcus fuscideae]